MSKGKGKQGSVSQKKKLDSTIIVAIIGLIGTLVTAIFASPVLIAWLQKPSTPTPMSVSPASPTQKTLKTNTPIQTATLIPVTATVTNEKRFDNNCISRNSWTPYNGEINPIENDCWKLLDFGYYVQDGTLFIAVDNNKNDIQHGIYTSIPLKARIDFKIQIEKIQTLFDQPVKITFGIIQADPINLEAGKYFTYQFNGISQPDFLDIKLGDSPDFGQFIAEKLFIGASQNRVTMLLDGIYLQVFLDGNQVGDTLTIPFDKRNFWIGFIAPAGSRLNVKISEFVIQER